MKIFRNGLLTSVDSGQHNPVMLHLMELIRFGNQISIKGPYIGVLIEIVDDLLYVGQ